VEAESGPAAEVEAEAVMAWCTGGDGRSEPGERV
jgi:hypothetical protein